MESNGTASSTGWIDNLNLDMKYRNSTGQQQSKKVHPLVELLRKL